MSNVIEFPNPDADTETALEELNRIAKAIEGATGWSNERSLRAALMSDKDLLNRFVSETAKETPK
jgi:hypothetical protein